MHISQIADKTASNLVKTDLDNNPYHNRIKQDAAVLARNKKGNYTYIGSSTATIWEGPLGNRVVVRNGKVE